MPRSPGSGRFDLGRVFSATAEAWWAAYRGAGPRLKLGVDLLRRVGPSSGSRLPSLGRDLPGRATFDRLAPLVAVGVGVGPKHRALPAVSLSTRMANPCPARGNDCPQTPPQSRLPSPMASSCGHGEAASWGCSTASARLGRALQCGKQVDGRGGRLTRTSLD